MNNNLSYYLFFCNFVIYLTDMGLLPLLPLYAMQFGATRTVVGLYLAVTYASITAGTLLTSRLARHRRSGRSRRALW